MKQSESKEEKWNTRKQHHLIKFHIFLCLKSKLVLNQMSRHENRHKKRLKQERTSQKVQELNTNQFEIVCL